MQQGSIQEGELAVRAACERGDYQAGVELTLALYGDELLRYLISSLHAYDDGWDAFSLLTDDLWRGLPAFEFRSSVRSWAYTLARNASHRYARQRAVHQRRHEPQPGSTSLVAPVPRSATERCLVTRVKERVRALRERLSEEEREILTLRVDRKLSFAELAQVLHTGTRLSGPDLSREEARLRKRFERITQRLRTLAQAEGLLD